MLHGEPHEASGLVLAPLVAMVALLLLLSWRIHLWIEGPLSRFLRRRLEGDPGAAAPAVARLP